MSRSPSRRGPSLRHRLPAPPDPRAVVRRTITAASVGSEARDALAALPRRTVHEPLPAIPRRATADDLVFAARALVRDAVTAEFIREGLAAIDLPENATRAQLNAADLLTDREFLGFMDRTLAVVAVAPPLPGAREARALAAAPGSRDRCGLSLEAASGLASYLVGAAARLAGIDMPDEERLAAFVDEQAARVLAGARDALARSVTAPQELQRLRALRARLDASPEGADASDRTEPVDAPPASSDEHDEHDEHDDDATRPERDSGPSAGSTRPRASGPRLSAADLARAASLARSAKDFLDTDTGRAALDLAKRGAASLNDRGKGRPGR